MGRGTVFKEGVVNMSSTLIKKLDSRFKQRYFKLFQDRIRYYKNEKGTYHIGEIFLYNCNIKSPENETAQQSEFKFIMNIDNKKTTIVLSDLNERNDWVEKIKNV